MIDYTAIREQAEKVAPYPNQEPWMAGLVGTMVAAFGCALFMAIAGIPERGRTEIATIVVMLMGFIGPYTDARSKIKKHSEVHEFLLSRARWEEDQEAK